MPTKTDELLQCDKCQHVFFHSEHGSKRELVSSDPYPMYENVVCCPMCGHEDLSEVIRCERCGEVYYKDEAPEKCLKCEYGLKVE